mgnify:FL=1
MKPGLFKLLSIFVIPIVMLFSSSLLSFAADTTCPKPMVLKFTSPMCSACRQLEQVFPGIEAKYAGKIEVKK